MIFLIVEARYCVKNAFIGFNSLFAQRGHGFNQLFVADLAGMNFVIRCLAKRAGFIADAFVLRFFGSFGNEVCDYVSRKLWTPMHAEESALWSLDRKDGMEKAYCCFNSNARDFARFGQLLLNNGQWDDRQLISPAYLAEATSPDTRLVYKDLGKPNHCYGFQYWILDYKGMKIPYMRGILGQYVFTLPEKNAVIVRLGHKRSDTYTADQHYPDDINTWLDAAMDLLQ